MAERVHANMSRATKDVHPPTSIPLQSLNSMTSTFPFSPFAPPDQARRDFVHGLLVFLSSPKTSPPAFFGPAFVFCRTGGLAEDEGTGEERQRSITSASSFSTSSTTTTELVD